MYCAHNCLSMNIDGNHSWRYIVRPSGISIAICILCDVESLDGVCY